MRHVSYLSQDSQKLVGKKDGEKSHKKKSQKGNTSKGRLPMTQTQQRVFCTHNTQNTPGVGWSESGKDKTLLSATPIKKVFDPPQCLFVR